MAGSLIACSDGFSDEESDSRGSISSVSGNAVKGLLINGTIRAYQIDPDTDQRIPLGTTTTDEYGEFNLNLITPVDAHTNPVIVEFEAEDSSAMICDLVQGCLNLYNSAFYDFGELMPLDPDFLMLGLVDGDDAFLSPLSHLLVSTAQQLPGGLSRANIDISAQQIAEVFSLSTPLLKTKTIDISSLNALNLSDSSQLTQAIWSAAFYELSQTQEWVDQSYQLNNIPLAQLYSNAITLINNLESSLSGLPRTHVSANLNSLKQSANELYDDITSDSLHFVYQPRAAQLNEGDALILNALAVSPDEEVNYQWLRNDEPIEGATQAVFNIEISQLSDQGTYRVIASTVSGSVISLSVQIDIQYVPETLYIIEQPQSQHIQIGQPFSLSVTATGEGELTYQWQRNGSVIPGANEASYSVTQAQASDEGSYRVIISDTLDEIQSDFVDVMVNEELTPVTITSQPENLALVEGMNASFNVIASGGGFLSYQWLKDGIAIPNATTSQLDIIDVSISDIGLYSVIVSNSLGSQGSESAQLTVLSSTVPLVITRQPVSQTVEVNDSALFSVEASGEGTLSYQWLLNEAEIPGANDPTYLITGASTDHAGEYTVRVEDSSSTIQSNPALLTVEALRELQLSWSIPTHRENGDPLPVEEIGGYVIEYGTDHQALDQRIEINSAQQTNCTLSDLSKGTLYLRIATVDAQGVQGIFSGIVAITIP